MGLSDGYSHLILEKDIIIPISKLKKKQIKDAYLNAISKEMDQ